MSESEFIHNYRRSLYKDRGFTHFGATNDLDGAARGSNLSKRFTVSDVGPLNFFSYFHHEAEKAISIYGITHNARSEDMDIYTGRQLQAMVESAIGGTRFSFVNGVIKRNGKPFFSLDALFKDDELRTDLAYEHKLTYLGVKPATHIPQVLAKLDTYHS